MNFLMSPGVNVNEGLLYIPLWTGSTRPPEQLCRDGLWWWSELVLSSVWGGERDQHRVIEEYVMEEIHRHKDYGTAKSIWHDISTNNEPRTLQNLNKCISVILTLYETLKAFSQLSGSLMY